MVTCSHVRYPKEAPGSSHLIRLGENEGAVSRLRRNCQARILYPARSSFTNEGKINNFQDKQKLKEFATTHPALQNMLKDFCCTEQQRMKVVITKEHEDRKPPNKCTKETQRKQQRYLWKKNHYLSIITLNANDLYYPIKRYWFAERIKKRSICLLPTRNTPHQQ